MHTPAKSTVIPNFLVASSPLGLRRLMLFNNKKHGAWLKYDPIQFVNGKWYAWYYAESVQSDDALLKEVNNGAVD